MPGIIMDGTSANGPGREIERQHVDDTLSTTASLAPYNNGNHSNGPSHAKDAACPSNPKFDDFLPPELVHITQGFFPLGHLINRATQQCWNDLTDLITELANPQSTATHAAAGPVTTTNGKYTLSPSSAENAQKKLRILEFAQAKRADFIKILVLSQWSRRAADVSRLIDIQAFIRMRYDCYNGAILSIGEMKRDLIRAQTANPDLAMALEVLATGRVAAIQERSFVPPKPLTPKEMLKTLKKINKTIRTRLVLHDQIPRAFTNYVVHDGRVTFKVPAEFEVDLSIAQESHSSQFFFVDIRFLFSPSPPKPAGRLLDELDNRVNAILMHSGLTGCYNLLHNLILSNKITILFHQAVELAREHWLDTLRVEVLHRTLVVQYWINRPGPKSWIEIGVKGGRRKEQTHDGSITESPFLGLRWMRDNKEVESKDIKLDPELLSMETILRSVTALHISFWLQSTYTKLSQGRLYASGALSVGLQTSINEPGNCFLDVQLTKGRSLRVMIEPVSGAIIFRPTPLLLNRYDIDRSFERPIIDDILFRISRLRSTAVIEEVESLATALGWETVNSRDIKNEDLRRIFPSNILRSVLFFRKSWECNYGIAYTCSMDGDNWWVVELRAPSRDKGPFSPQSARMVTGRFGGLPERLNYASFSQLDYALSGMLAIHVNACYLSELHGIHYFPSVRNLSLGPHLQVPSIFIRFRSGSLPSALRISPSITADKNPTVRDTVRLSFRGIHPSSQCAILLAHGNLSREIKDLALLAVHLDPTITFQPNGRGFAMRFLTPVGKPMIIQLLARLQQLEHVISTLDTLKQKSLKLLSVSLSKIKFSYAADEGARAIINFNYHEQSIESDIDSVTLLSKQAPLMLLRMSIDFHQQNPHRRVKESLTSTLNGLRPGARAGAGLEAVLKLLVITRPILQALERISTGSRSNLPGNSGVQITTRSSKIFHLRYPSLRYRFCIHAGLRRDRVVWVLRDMTTMSDKTGREAVELKLKEQIFGASGDGWQGLGNGAIADCEKIGNLVSALHGVLTDYISSETGGGLGMNPLGKRNGGTGTDLDPGSGGSSGGSDDVGL
ncbi:conserved hypothetical protein [Histoplasma capsulatum var. duboisii H88]|uniref:Mediator of RNA polymerase II transcription subunit 14 n=2 Tax=Ajellomyces capsulatus TaxID=5037 RepID=F0UIA5_AJEC8|nr:conserved hypothetical protein [Histoplasma capsulatum var. duboisii H88]QSS56978.1 mediator of RNA polymerase II transcription subunit 14 [Histoplasma capsulatum var. duboisii H88]